MSDAWDDTFPRCPIHDYQMAQLCADSMLFEIRVKDPDRADKFARWAVADHRGYPPNRA